MDYSVSYMLGTSASGVETSAQGGTEPLDINVGMNIDLQEFPKVIPQSAQSEEQKTDQRKIIPVKFTTTRDKFLQFSRDMRGALALLEQSVTDMSQMTAAAEDNF